MKKITFIFIISLCSFLVRLPVAEANMIYSDVPKNAYYYEATVDLLDSKILIRPGPLLKPAEIVSRGEAAIFMSRTIDALHLQKEKYHMQPFYFKDVKVDDPLYPHVIKMSGYGVMKGWKPNEFGKNGKLTRSQAVKLLAETFEIPLHSTKHYYPDVPKQADYAKYVNRLHEIGVIEGSKGKFMPAAYLTRSQWLAMIHRVKTWDANRDDDKKGVPFVNHPNQLFLEDANQLANNWKKYQPTYQGFIFSQLPQIEGNFRAGQLRPGFIEDGLKAVKFVRSIAGLSTTVRLDPVFNEEAQAAALVLAVRNEGLSHYPPAIKGMDKTLFNKGYQGASTSNIAYGYWSFDDSVLFGYMADEDDINREDVGHRLWMLNPHLQKVGFGFVESKEPKRPYSAIKVVDDHEIELANSPSIITWPTAGAFPYEMLKLPVSSNTLPWSVSFSEDKYKQPNMKEVHVELKRLRDGKKWVFNKDRQDGFFKISSSGIGKVGHTLIFQPTHTIYPLVKGDIFQVNIKGLRDSEGRAATYQYQVLLVGLNK